MTSSTEARTAEVKNLSHTVLVGQLALTKGSQEGMGVAELQCDREEVSMTVLDLTGLILDTYSFIRRYRQHKEPIDRCRTASSRADRR